MRKRGVSFLIFIGLLMTVVVGLCIIGSATSAKMANGGSLNGLLPQTSYNVIDWKSTENPGEYSITIYDAPTRGNLALIVYDIGEFELWQDGSVLYFYTAQDTEIRTHTIQLKPADTLNLIIKSDKVYAPSGLGRFSSRHNTQLLLTTAESADSMDLFVVCVNWATIGAYILIIIYSISSYLKKRSEGYLLLLCGLAVLALASAFTYSNIMTGIIAKFSAPIRYLRLFMCMAATFKLLNISLSGRWKYLYSWQSIALCSLLFCVMDELGLQSIVDHICYLGIFPCGYACIKALNLRIPGAMIMTLGTVIREGMRIYFRLILADVLVTPEIFCYFYLPQAYNLLFVLCCIILVNTRFASKFNEADMLTVELKNLNQHLDSLVLERTNELEKTNQLLLDAQQKKHRMMTNIFHDLRTPIFCAMGSADMINVTEAQSKKRLDILKDRLDYLSHMSEELFTLSSIEEKAETMELFRIRSDVLCEPIAVAAQFQAGQLGITFEADIQKNLFFSGDSYQMKHALENLLSNAFKFTPKGGSVSFTVSECRQEVAFTVSDTGCGISEEMQAHIFERAYSKNGFSGFGLSIAAAVAHVHKGRIAVKSSPGAGSSFTITLPLEEE